MTILKWAERYKPHWGSAHASTHRHRLEYNHKYTNTAAASKAARIRIRGTMERPPSKFPALNPVRTHRALSKSSLELCQWQMGFQLGGRRPLDRLQGEDSTILVHPPQSILHTPRSLVMRNSSICERCGNSFQWLRATHMIQVKPFFLAETPQELYSGHVLGRCTVLVS